MEEIFFIKKWWRKSAAFSALLVKVGRGVRPSWTRLKGDEHDVETIQIQEKSTGNLDCVLHKNGKSCNEHLEEFEITYSL